MQDLINTITLISAALASMALGVLLAYGVCRMAFAAFGMHARSVAQQRPAAKTVLPHAG